MKPGYAMNIDAKDEIITKGEVAKKILVGSVLLEHEISSLLKHEPAVI